MITTLIFDCFGVICDHVIGGWYHANRLEKGFPDENIKNVLHKFDLGEFSEDDIVDYFSKYDGVNSTKEELREQIDSYLNINLPLTKIIKELRNKKFKTVLLSNANASFFERKLYPTYPEFVKLFDKIIISSEVKMVKPNKNIFEYALQKIASQPSESLFIDDSSANVDGAIACGMHGFVYTDVPSFNDFIKKRIVLKKYSLRN
jgi:HAD superfamily hydrolase (TIGR01509 family)